MKKVITLLVDSLMPNILENCMSQKTVPALKFLVDRGKYWSDCVTVFPTMTASVDCSLLTGVYPNVHKVPGLIWFDPQTKEIINYLNDWKCITKLGVSKCVKNAIYDLNEKHLSKDVKTLFEELSDKGRTSASINAFVHRGHVEHPVKLPFPLNLMLKRGVNKPVHGPDIMTLGSIIQGDVERSIPQNLKAINQHLGINDPFAILTAKKLIQSDNQPDFMLVYLPDNDHKIHQTNPDHAEKSLIKVDQQIQEILNTFDSWDDALDKCVFIVISDHGQTKIENDKSFNIDLDELLKSFHNLQLGETYQNHDLVVANNERMAYVYPLNRDKERDIIHKLCSESCIDIIAWKEGKGVRAAEGGSGREIYFEPNGSYTDIYNGSWLIDGEWSTLDLYKDQEKIHYGDYPDALSRLYGALYSQEIPMIVITARPRYELKNKYYPTHLGGGSHGSLHKYDSMIPLIVAGTQHTFKQPPRLVDIKQFVMELFD